MAGTSGFKYLSEGINLIKFYREQPIIAAEDLLNVKLAVPQRRLLTDYWTKNFVAVTAARGSGKTFVSAVFACLWAMLFPGQRVGLLAPSFRQAKMLFSEVEKIWSISPILQESTSKPPIKASDRCYLTFRQAGKTPPSMIDAIPLGDGAKIRGARYYVILADEFAQIPVEIFNTVILPMGATVANPMENVERIAKQEELIRRGLAAAGDFSEAGKNKVIMTSSAYYQFNHMYQTIQEYNEAISKGDDRYATHNISYRDMPRGFLSEDNISNAKTRLSRLEFRMEYEAIWEADSSGVFKASLIERCRRLSNHTVEIKGKSGSQYILGVDPARAADGFSLVLIELSSPNKVIAAWEFYQNSYPKMAETVMEVCSSFNVIAVHMDAGAGGGGTALKDLLAEEERFGSARILDAEDPNNVHLTGRKILYMFNPSPKTNAEAVHATLSLLEHDSLTFPKRPQPDSLDEKTMSELDEKEEIYETVDKMIRQIMLIEVTQNKTGTAHFDVPSGGGHAAQKKDLYTAFILASKKVYDLAMNEDEPSMIEVGIVENRIINTPVFADNLSKNMDVLPAPVTSWAYRKTFKPR